MAKLVNWYGFSNQLKGKHIILFSALDVQRIFGSSKVASDFLLQRYAKKGFIMRIKRGLYGFPDALPPDPYLANRLCEPSYVSLEYALSYHGIIPENVYEITSVTTKTTRQFVVSNKIFSYHRLKTSAFTGYRLEKQHGQGFKIADPEKAFVDSTYLRTLSRLKPLPRLRLEKLHAKKALSYAALFQDQKLMHIIKNIFS